jgi:hypothetical protein
MKKKNIDIDSNMKRLENEVRLYHELDALIKSYQKAEGLSAKDIISVIERIKYQILLDGINIQIGSKEKLDRFARKWNLLKREGKESGQTKSFEGKSKGKIKIAGTKALKIKGAGKLKKKNRFKLKFTKKDSDKFLNKMKRKLKVARCENCGYFYVHDEEKGVFQCTFFEFSSEVNKKDVCENWLDNKQIKQSFV